MQAEKLDFLQKYTILPNKNGVSKKVGDKNDLLHSDIDAQKSNYIIDIYKIINHKNCRDFLLHPEIKIADVFEIPKYGINHISIDMDLVIEKRT